MQSTIPTHHGIIIRFADIDSEFLKKTIINVVLCKSSFL